MKKTLAMIIGLGFALACADSVTEPAADPPAPAFSANSNGAVVHHDEIGCSLIDANGNWYPPDFSLPCGLEVATYGDQAVSSLSAQAENVPNPTGQTIRWGPYNVEGTDWAAGYPELTGPPYPCYVLGTEYLGGEPLFTVNWRIVITPSGNGSLVCHYSKKWEFNCEDYGNCA